MLIMARGLGRLLSAVLDIVFESRTWKEFWVARGDQPDYATRLYGVLQGQGVRCRYQVVGPAASGMGGFTMHTASSQTLKVLVHRDDLYTARQVMSQLESP